MAHIIVIAADSPAWPRPSDQSTSVTMSAATLSKPRFSWMTDLPGRTRTSTPPTDASPVPTSTESRANKPTAPDITPTSSLFSSPLDLLDSITSSQISSSVESAVTSKSTPPTPARESVTQISDDSGHTQPGSRPSMAAIGGIVAVVMLTLVGLSIFALLHLKKRNKRKDQDETTPVGNPTLSPYVCTGERAYSAKTNEDSICGGDVRNTMEMTNAEVIDVATALRWAEDNRLVPHSDDVQHHRVDKINAMKIARKPLPPTPSLHPTFRTVLARGSPTLTSAQNNIRASSSTIFRELGPHAMTPEDTKATRLSQIQSECYVSPHDSPVESTAHGTKRYHGEVSPTSSDASSPVMYRVLCPG